MSINKCIFPLLILGLLAQSCKDDSKQEEPSLSDQQTSVATKPDKNQQLAEAKVDAIINESTPSAKEEAAAEVAAEREEKAAALEAAQKEEERQKRKEERLKAKEKAAAKAAKKSKKPVVEFYKTVYKYGNIEQGETIEFKFKFKNTGSSDLVVSDATATCGCTKPSYPFIPIGPGEEGYIGVLFDSKGKLGRQKPAITVTTNADPASYTLYLEGFVDSPEEKKAEDKKEIKEGRLR